MKSALLPLMLLVLLVSACAEKHYSKLNAESDKIAFYYKNPEAQEVLFASSQDNYTPIAARETRKHLWEISVSAEKGFTYFYVVDGVITLPNCPFTENDDFGSKNCLYIVDM